MSMELQVKISKVLDGRGFTARDGQQKVCHSFVGEFYGGQYKNNIKFDVWDEAKWKEWLSNGLRVGVLCTVHFDVKSNENNGRWFTNATCWNVTNLDTSAQSQTQGNAAPTSPTPPTPPQSQLAAPSAAAPASPQDDLPF